MTLGRRNNLASTVGAALEALQATQALTDVIATSQAPGAWFVRSGGRLVRVRLAEQWLHVTGDFARGRIHGPAVPPCAWELLECNAASGGAARLVLPPGSTRVQAAAELFLEGGSLADPAGSADLADPSPLSSALREHLDDLLAVMAPAVRRGDAADVPDAGIPPDAPNCPDLAALCGDAGWPAHRRGDGTVAVPLEAPHCAVRAELLWDGALRAWAPVAAMKEDPGEPQRQAVGVLLLQIAGGVRTVRPAVRRRGGRVAAGLEVFLGRRPSPRPLAEALSALSVACAMASREVALLIEDPVFSRRFLAECGWSAPARGAAQDTNG